MSKAVVASLLAVALLIVPAAPSYGWGSHGNHGSHEHHGHFHGHAVIVAGPAFWWGPGWWDYPPPYAYPSPIVVSPPVYGPESYWYYCPSARAYYPTALTCPEVWIKVPPRHSKPLTVSISEH